MTEPVTNGHVVDMINVKEIREMFSEVIGEFSDVIGDLHLHEPVNDYADPLIKARKHLNHLEILLRKRDMKAAMEEIPQIETQCLKLRNFLYREMEK